MLKTILLRRLVGGIFILWLVSVLVFAAIHLLPGNAATILVGHSDTTPQEVASLTRQLGLDQPLIIQYGRWIKGLVTGNWGTSLVSSLPVSYIVRTRLENSGALTLISMLMLSPLAIIIGTVSAIRRNRAIDHVTSLVTLCLSAVPAFAIGVMVIYLLATNVVHWLPAASILSATEFVGPPFSGPSGTAPFGTDTLGRDVLSRFLDGGRKILTIAFAGTALGIAVGTALGLVRLFQAGRR
jgi:peptide/nickel transport system permease protein